MRGNLFGLIIAGLVFGAGSASAQGFINPSIGYGFGGDAGCPGLTDCEDQPLNAAVSVGALGRIIGMELEGAYAHDFFGTAPELSSSLMTAMGNFLLVPQVGPIRPFMLIGVGLMKTHVDRTPAGLLAPDDIINDTMFGWDVGGGVMAFAGSHFGVRGDLRYFHSFRDFSVIGFTLPSVKFNYSRASAGVILKF